MKKIFIIAILASFVWGQEIKCQYDETSMRKTDDYQYISDKITYKWVCNGFTMHEIWITSENQSNIKANQDNTRELQNQVEQQQAQQQPQQQQVLPDYSPIIEAMKDKRTEEQKRKDAEERTTLAEDFAFMKKTRSGTIILYIIQAGTIYFLYVLATDS